MLFRSQWINVVTNIVKIMLGIFPPKSFPIFDGFMVVTNTFFYIYDGRMFIANNNTIKNYILYFRCIKAVTGVTSSDGFYLVIVNNTLLAVNIFMPSYKVRRQNFLPK